jgi:hypothetical protein
MHRPASFRSLTYPNAKSNSQSSVLPDAANREKRRFSIRFYWL